MSEEKTVSVETQDGGGASQQSIERADPELSAPADKGRQGQLIRATHLFEQMLELVAPHGSPVSTVPGPALLSLLHQCEQVAALEHKSKVATLIAMPGLPILDPTWWQGAAGWDVIRLPDSNSTNHNLPQPAQLASMLEVRAQIGQRLLAVISTDDTHSKLPSHFQPAAMLHCHPWQAFLASADATSLDEFSSAILAVLDQHQDLPLHRIDAGQLLNPAECQNVLLRLIDDGTPSALSERGEPDRWVENDYIGGSPAYDELCRRLGYEPTRVVEWLPNAGVSRVASDLRTVVPKDDAPTAIVSWFIDSVSALPSGATLTARMRPLISLLDLCLAAPDFPEAIDKAAGQLPPADAALLRLLAAAHFQRSEDSLQSMTLIADALEGAEPGFPGLQQAGALLYLELKRPLQALEALTIPMIAKGAAGERGAADLRKAIFKDTDIEAVQHGQALLLAALKKELPLPNDDGRQRIMIEVGTTRETLPGQGSTRQLALLCAELGIDFVTVDMDPANTRRAARMFRRLGLPFSAVNGKGEGYLSDFEGPIDYVFLDAYDFDHGKHSDLRQSRYEQFLGRRINDAECHQMHLDCAQTLSKKLSPDGLICFDDTWTDENGAWTAKGTTAMPFLLGDGFTVIEARNHAALLKRHKD